jgi:hypothetical protein
VKYVGNRNSSLTLAGRAWRMELSGSAKVGVAVPTFAATALPCRCKQPSLTARLRPFFS